MAFNKHFNPRETDAYRGKGGLGDTGMRKTRRERK